MAIEYNGEYHYKFVPVYLSIISSSLLFRHASWKVQERDKLKRWICSRDGITLVVIPYWWNKTPESIARTIHEARPDMLFPEELLKGDSIRTEAPKEKTNSTIFILSDQSSCVLSSTGSQCSVTIGYQRMVRSECSCTYSLGT